MQEAPDRPNNTTAGRRRRGSPAVRPRPVGRFGARIRPVGDPPILLLLAVLQLGLVFLGNYMLEHATAQGARLIRTGQAQTQGFDAAAFKTEVCKYLTAPLSCSGLKLDVRRFTNFSSTELTNPLDAGGAMKTNFSYDPGKGGDVVVVRGFYEFDIPSLFPIEISMSQHEGRQPRARRHGRVPQRALRNNEHVAVMCTPTNRSGPAPANGPMGAIRPRPARRFGHRVRAASRRC